MSPQPNDLNAYGMIQQTVEADFEAWRYYIACSFAYQEEIDDQRVPSALTKRIKYEM